MKKMDMKIKKSFNKKKKFFPPKKIEQFLLSKNKFQWKLLNMIIVTDSIQLMLSIFLWFGQPTESVWLVLLFGQIYQLKVITLSGAYSSSLSIF
jgi:hypothetical protein